MEWTTQEDRVKTGWILVSISILLTSSIIFWYVGNPQRFLETRMGIREGVFSELYIWIFTLIIIVGYITYTIMVVPFVRAHLFKLSWLKIIGIWAAIVTGIVEEILFRQFLMDFLQSMEVSNILQILLSGAAFGLAHGAWGFLRGDFRITLPVMISTTVLGCLLATLYIMTGRSTLAPIIAHVIINLAIEPWLMLSAVSGKWNIKK